jgi:hypothetical protein
MCVLSFILIIHYYLGSCQITFFIYLWPSREPSWSWSYGSWIANYLYNQCLSPLTLWVRIPSRRRVLDAKLCDQVCQWVATCRWLSPVSSINKTDRQDITEILLKVALNTITLTAPLTVKSDTRQLRHTYVDQLDHSSWRVLRFIKIGNRRLVRWKYKPWEVSNRMLLESGASTEKK